MATLGDITYNTLKADRNAPVDTPGDQVEEITRDGVDGRAVRKLAKRAHTQRFVGDVDIVAGDTAALQTAVDLHKALQGTIVTMVDDHGLTTTGVSVEEVDVNVSEAVGNVGGQQGADADYILRVEFVLANTKVA